MSLSRRQFLSSCAAVALTPVARLATSPAVLGVDLARGASETVMHIGHGLRVHDGLSFTWKARGPIRVFEVSYISYAPQFGRERPR